MKFKASREELLKPLQSIIGVVERRQTMPILANFLLKVENGALWVTASDMEIQIIAKIKVDVESDGETTIPGRKLVDICRALPVDAPISLSLKGDRVQVQSGRSRFTLSTLKATDFPVLEDIKARQTVRLPQKELKHLLEKTAFAMAHQDVRYYLNGLAIEVFGNQLRSVATDGHRLALCEVDVSTVEGAGQQVIVPRKAVIELQRLLADEGDIEMRIGQQHIQAVIGDVQFTSKLVDGRFPDYERVIPAEAGTSVTADRESLREALQRTAILSNEKYRGIRLELKDNLVHIQANNPEQEEAEEDVEVEYQGDDMTIGFNVNYLLDALSAVESDQVEVGVTDANNSCIVREPGVDYYKYVVMPMRI
ncbi:MAG: DNA polymerase III subunit beta [Gammaproteobacteria bacterium]|nr:DNA polymerase III subunit beta [Gammaproteobacteria bacterium]